MFSSRVGWNGSKEGKSLRMMGMLWRRKEIGVALRISGKKDKGEWITISWGEEEDDGVVLFKAGEIGAKGNMIWKIRVDD